MYKNCEINKKTEWNIAISKLPAASILQTWEWGLVKSAHGWIPKHYIWEDQFGKIRAAALFLIRETKLPIISTKIRMVYVPQGPIMDWENEDLRRKVCDDLTNFAKDSGALFIKIDPEIILGMGEVFDRSNEQYLQAERIVSELQNRGWTYSPQQVQFKNTAWILLSESENELLNDMKQKTRYNVRLAAKKGVIVRKGGIKDLERLYKIYLETSLRDGFIIRPKNYYLDVWSTFIHAKMAVPLIAEVDNEIVAGLMLFHFNNRAWYLYGMSTNKHREKMPNYLLQWEAMKHSKKVGCTIYDLWGAPEVFDKRDRMWGVYRFKKGLGSIVVNRIGAYDFPRNKIAYKIFVKYIPKLLSLTRRIRKIRQFQELE